MAQKGFAQIIFVLGVLIVSGLIIGGALYLKSNKISFFRKNQSQDVNKTPTIKNKIAFVRRDGHIWLTDPDGNNQRPITSESDMSKTGDGFGGSIVWSPDNTKIAFIGAGKTNCNFASGCADDLYYFDFETNKVNKIPTPDDDGIHFHEYPITWAPDSNRYAFVSYSRQLIIGNVISGNQVAIYDASKVNLDPVLWSPKGEKILLMENVEGTSDGDVVIINPEGQVLKKIKASDIGLQDADITAIWGRDDNEIILSEHGTGKLEIHLIELDGSEEMRDMTTGEGDNFGYSEPVVSPKGSFIAVYHITGQTPQYFITEISIIKPDGTLVKENITQGIPKEYPESIVWSPNEDALAIEVKNTIWVVSLDGQYSKILENAFYPAWSSAL